MLSVNFIAHIVGHGQPSRRISGGTNVAQGSSLRNTNRQLPSVCVAEDGMRASWGMSAWECAWDGALEGLLDFVPFVFKCLIESPVVRMHGSLRRHEEVRSMPFAHGYDVRRGGAKVPSIYFVHG